MITSLLDRFYAGFSNRRLFFSEGWGDLTRLRELHRAEVRPTPPAAIDIDWEKQETRDEGLFRRGAFTSPYSLLPLPEESRTVRFELVLPHKTTPKMPVCLHFAATGDEGFTRRRVTLALPLLKEGIASLIPENPFYGMRRPAGQDGKMLRRFSDLCAMGGAAVEEGRSLLEWLRRAGFTRLGVCGISMGGSMAAQVAALSDEPLAMVGCITAHSATAVFTEGILKRYLAWEALDRELGSEGPAIELMRTLLDSTDVRRLPPPRCLEAAILVAAKRDAYVPPASALLVHEHWPGATMRWLEGGHVGAFLFHRNAFLRAIRDAFARL